MLGKILVFKLEITQAEVGLVELGGIGLVLYLETEVLARQAPLAEHLLPTLAVVAEVQLLLEPLEPVAAEAVVTALILVTGQTEPQILVEEVAVLDGIQSP